MRFTVLPGSREVGHNRISPQISTENLLKNAMFTVDSTINVIFFELFLKHYLRCRYIKNPDKLSTRDGQKIFFDLPSPSPP